MCVGNILQLYLHWSTKPIQLSVVSLTKPSFICFRMDITMTTQRKLLWIMTILIGCASASKAGLCGVCQCELYGTVVQCKGRGLTEPPTADDSEQWLLPRVVTINLDGNRLSFIHPGYWAKFTNLESVTFKQASCVNTTLPASVTFEGTLCDVSYRLRESHSIRALHNSCTNYL